MSTNPSPYSGGGGGSVTSVTAADTSIVVGGTGAAPTIATGTLDVIATQHAPAADWSNNSHKITSLANGSGAQDAAAFGQIPLLDSTAGDYLPEGVAAAGSGTKAARPDHVHPANAWQSLLLAPSGALAETYPRMNLSSTLVTTQVTLSGSAYLSAIALPAGLVIGHVVFRVGGQAATTLTHGWFGIADSGLVVRAVSADQTSGNWSINTNISLAVTYTVPSTGLYYLFVQAAATQQPAIDAIATAGPLTITPALNISASGAGTALPTVGTTTFTSTGNPNLLYGYVAA